MASLGPRIYNLFPKLVGPIARWADHLERIAAMGFDWVYVNPFHETGESGSLYAVKNYYRLDGRIRGDAGDSDDDLLRAFVEAARTRGLAVMMDLVVNHTARDADLVAEHPDWYVREPDGSVHSPGAVDPDDPAKITVWTDLAELDYSDRPARRAMTAYFADVLRHYVRLGIAGFRCDAAYKVPGPVWSELIAAARVIDRRAFFAAETLGCTIEQVMNLGDAGFDSLFNSSKWWDFRAPWLLEQYEQFRHIAPSIAFPESHDTPRLAAELGDRPDAEVEAEYRFRYLFAAFFSSGVMMPIGYEFGFAKPLDVVLTNPDDWEEPRFDLSAFVAGVNAMKAAIPALNEEGAERRVTAPETLPLALVRNAASGASLAVALLNPEPEAATIEGHDVLETLDGTALRDVTPEHADAGERRLDAQTSVRLGPREIRIFAATGGTASANGVRNGAGASAGNAEATDVDAVPVRNAKPVVIERVWPELDAGRFPVKRTVGERFAVEADVFREGHDAIAAVLKYRERGSDAWRETAMVPLGNDRWRGTFVLERNARYEYTVEGRPDAYASWQHDVRKKREAGQNVALELVEGRALVDDAFARAPRAVKARLEGALAAADGAPDDDERADALLSDAVATAMARVPDRSQATTFARTLAVTADRRAATFSAWYELFPRSQGTTPGVHGTFADAARRLGDVRAMGFDVVYLPPIHPIGHAFRKGRNNALETTPDDPGSPWAIGNEHGGHTAVEPKLGTLADFDAFVAAARAHGLEIALDYALQCSPDHPYVKAHPEWFAFRPDGSIKYAENPPKKYQDIVNFNWYGPDATALWAELRDVVLFWVGRGVKIFRVDNPHTKPFDFWEWMIADVQARHPDVLFLAEAFTRPKVMYRLAKLGFTQSYTYFTWRNFKAELTAYLDELAHGEPAEFFRPNFFANTPDILPPFLQTGGRPAFLIRLVLAATLSSVYGLYSGYELCENAALEGREEYADSEKYEIKVRDWDAPGNIKADIATLNRMRRENPALQDWRNVRFHPSSDDAVIFFSKVRDRNALLVVVNLDPFDAHETELQLPLAELGIGADETFEAEELLGGSKHFWSGPTLRVRLDPSDRVATIFRVTNRMHVAYASPSD